MASEARGTNRRNAKKSRAGCFNCKARKVKARSTIGFGHGHPTANTYESRKCSETRPACERCQARDLFCTYPSKAQQRNVRRQSGGHLAVFKPSIPVTPVNPCFLSFKPRDFQYFSHFMTAAYPPLPHDNDMTWTTSIPQIAHHYTPLLHAVLALGAAHLSIDAPDSEQSTDAVLHRGLAFSGLRELLSRESHTDTELDVMLAICYAMTFQSAYTADGMTDFVTMIRGCHLVGDPTNHCQGVLRRLQTAPSLDPDELQEGCEALKLVYLLLELDVQESFYNILLQTLRNLQRSPPEAYFTFTQVYAIWHEMDEDIFRSFIDNDNVSQILFAYYTALVALMQVYSFHEMPNRLPNVRMCGLISVWLDSIIRRLPAEMRGYMRWPFGVVKAFSLNYRAFGSYILGLARWSLKVANSKSDSKVTREIVPLPHAIDAV